MADRPAKKQTETDREMPWKRAEREREGEKTGGTERRRERHERPPRCMRLPTYQPGA